MTSPQQAPGVQIDAKQAYKFEEQQNINDKKYDEVWEMR